MSDDDFRQAMEGVTPLRQRNTVSQSRAGTPSEQQLKAREHALGIKPPPVPGELTLGEVPLVEPRAFLEWKKEGVQDLVIERLRKGRYEVADQLDLHGERIKPARRMVHDFLTQAHHRGHRCVLITHGRGEKSATPARMKSYVASWLEAHPLTNAFVSATRQHGGTGSVFVLLKKSPEAKETNRQLHGGKGEPEDDLQA